MHPTPSPDTFSPMKEIELHLACAAAHGRLARYQLGLVFAHLARIPSALWRLIRP